MSHEDELRFKGRTMSYVWTFIVRSQERVQYGTGSTWFPHLDCFWTDHRCDRVLSGQADPGTMEISQGPDFHSEICEITFRLPWHVRRGWQTFGWGDSCPCQNLGQGKKCEHILLASPKLASVASWEWNFTRQRIALSLQHLEGVSTVIIVLVRLFIPWSFDFISGTPAEQTRARGRHENRRDRVYLRKAKNWLPTSCGGRFSFLLGGNWDIAVLHGENCPGYPSPAQVHTFFSLSQTPKLSQSPKLSQDKSCPGYPPPPPVVVCPRHLKLCEAPKLSRDKSCPSPFPLVHFLHSTEMLTWDDVVLEIYAESGWYFQFKVQFLQITEEKKWTTERKNRLRTVNLPVCTKPEQLCSIFPGDRRFCSTGTVSSVAAGKIMMVTSLAATRD